MKQALELIQAYIPKDKRESITIAIAEADSHKKELDGLLAKPKKGTEDKVYNVALSYALARLDTYRIEIQLLQSMAHVNMVLIQERVDELAAMEQVPPDRTPGGRGTGFDSIPSRTIGDTEDERQALQAKRKVVIDARRAIVKERSIPEGAYKKAMMLTRALRGRAKSQFRGRPTGIELSFMANPTISDSTSTTGNNPLDTGNNSYSFQCCRFYAELRRDELTRLLTLTDDEIKIIARNKERTERLDERRKVNQAKTQLLNKAKREITVNRNKKLDADARALVEGGGI